MPLTRRSFVQTLGLGSVGVATLGGAHLFAARGREAFAGTPPWEWDAAAAADASAIRINSNENPLGPGQKALDAIQEMFREANRYPDRHETAVQAAVASARGVRADHVLMGCGSGEILRMCVSAWTSASRPLVTASPTFEDPGHHAHSIGSGVIDVPLDGDLRLDLDAMAKRASGAGLVYFCNPNNPSATVHGATAVQDFVATVNRLSPKTMLLIDEAYHEYVDDPSYRTAIPLALDNPRVIVARTFSKVYGMAGLRIGYGIARPETLDSLRRFKLGSGVNVLATAGAMAGLADTDRIETERARNREVRQFTIDAITKLGYHVTPSNANFIMFDARRNVQDVIDGCRRDGVLIGRPFPPLTTQARVSIGTGDEMHRAVDVLTRVLARSGTAQR